MSNPNPAVDYGNTADLPATPDPTVPVTVTPIVNTSGTTTGQAVTSAQPFATGTDGLVVRDYIEGQGWGPSRGSVLPRNDSMGVIGGTPPTSGDNPQLPTGGGNTTVQ